ncbi:MAG TPA: nucleotidyltransferase domain-containing protein [Moheibacter sp.]|nr:nucleotidyltransferase domain-containing protein [Moheibacter sp.]
MNLPKVITDNQNNLIILCQQHNVRKLYLFGSAVTSNFNDESDIDLIVDIAEKDPVEKGLLLLNFWDETENLLKRKVDLLSDKKIDNPYFNKSIEATKQLIYERKGA